MQPKNVHFIINPASGTEEPILHYIYQAVKDTGIDWAVTVTTNEGDIAETARALIGKTDVIAVYGGDGTVTRAAEALLGSTTPLAIIPGGTANVMSKELGIPQDVKEAIALILTGDPSVVKIDTGDANGRPFLLRINMGIMADMVISADRELKSKIGQAAYGVTAVKTAVASKPVNYKLTIDGKTITEEGVSLTVTNAGNIGIGNTSLLPGISVKDGVLDEILLKKADPLSLLQAAGSTFLNINADVVKHWQGKNIIVETDEPLPYICDDCEENAKRIDIKLLPASLHVIVPPESNA